MKNPSWTQMRRIARSFGALILASGLMTAPSAAQTPSDVTASGPEITSPALEREQYDKVVEYWTPENLLNAQPFEENAPVVENAPAASVVNAATAPIGGPGRPPIIALPPASAFTLIPQAMLQRETAQQGLSIEPQAVGALGAYFSTSRVFPDSTTMAYPFRAVGKLFFEQPGVGNFVCSAAVIRPRLVVTAGHCVAAPSTDESKRFFFTNFLFVPAYDNGDAPFARWTTNVVLVANDWYNSNGSVPNSQDVAILVMDDLSSEPQIRIGDVTGYLGWEINMVGNDHVTMLGYPCNLDNCEKMEETNSQAFAPGGNNTTLYGSPMRGGSSGGPWVQDFGIQPVGAPPVDFGGNVVVGITSYGPNATNPLYQGSSNLDDRFESLLNTACQVGLNNC